MHGIEFAARIGIEAGGAKDGGGYYGDKNKIGIVVVPGMPEYAPVMAGQEVEAKPSGTTGGGKGRKDASADQAAKPAWQRDAAPSKPLQVLEFRRIELNRHKAARQSCVHSVASGCVPAIRKKHEYQR